MKMKYVSVLVLSVVAAGLFSGCAFQMGKTKMSFMDGPVYVEPPPVVYVEPGPPPGPPLPFANYGPPMVYQAPPPGVVFYYHSPGVVRWHNGNAWRYHRR